MTLGAVLGLPAHTVITPYPSPTLSPTDPVPRGQLWPTGSVGAGHRVSRPRGTGSVGDSVGECARTRSLSHGTHATAKQDGEHTLRAWLFEASDAAQAGQETRQTRKRTLIIQSHGGRARSPFLAPVPSPTLSPTDPVPRRPTAPRCVYLRITALLASPP